MKSRKAIRTFKLTRYTAWESGGSVVKGGFVSGELYRYDADGYVLCRDDIKRLPLGVSPVFDDPLPEIRSHPDDIFHQFHRLCKDRPVHPLKDHAHIAHVADLKCKQVRVIDVPAPKGAAFFEPSRKIKVCDCFPGLQFRYSFHFFLPFRQMFSLYSFL